jgi:hypothetical protein
MLGRRKHHDSEHNRAAVLEQSLINCDKCKCLLDKRSGAKQVRINQIDGWGEYTVFYCSTCAPKYDAVQVRGSGLVYFRDGPIEVTKEDVPVEVEAAVRDALSEYRKTYRGPYPGPFTRDEVGFGWR